MAAVLSQYRETGGVATESMSMSAKNIRSHLAVLPASDSDMYSDSTVEVALLRCFLLAQTTAPPANVKSWPLVDFLSSTSPA